MIEVQFSQKQAQSWDLTATILPSGGLGLAQEVKLASLVLPNFRDAIAAVESLNEIVFEILPDRWPKLGPKFRIINELSHPDRVNYANYRVEHEGRVLARIVNYPRGSAISLIKKALEIVVRDAPSGFLKSVKKSLNGI